MDKIRINNLKFFTKNGVLAEEKRLGQQVEIDLEMQLSLAEAGRTDDVTQTVNYAEVNELIAQRVNNHSYDLIEGLASAILDDISADYQEQLDKILSLKLENIVCRCPAFLTILKLKWSEKYR